MDTRANHRKLLAWQEAMSLVEAVYRDTAALPPDERFGLAAQMRRAAVSVPSNIAEGAARNSRRELRSSPASRAARFRSSKLNWN